MSSAVRKSLIVVVAVAGSGYGGVCAKQAIRVAAGVAGSKRAMPLGKYENYLGPGADVLKATEHAKSDPGVTLELVPDAKETATGGPVGGPPGFDGS